MKRWAFLLLLVGCAADDHVVEPGQLAYGGMDPQITVPATARVGEPFTVAIATWGGGCIQEAARTDVSITEDGAEIRPYDVRSIPGDHGACLANLITIDHTVTLQFASPGDKRIVIRGVHACSDASCNDEPLNIVATVAVD